MNNKCKFSDECDVYRGNLKKDEKPLFLYHNVFCHAGPKGWHACKRFEIYNLGTKPPDDLLPENTEPVEKILGK